MCRLSEWCRDHQTTAPLYDREAVGAEGDAFFMFCLAKGVKETGRGGSREEAQEQAATKVLAKVEERERCRRVSSLASVLNTKRLSLEEPVSFLAKLALDQSFQVTRGHHGACVVIPGFVQRVHRRGPGTVRLPGKAQRWTAG